MRDRSESDRAGPCRAALLHPVLLLLELRKLTLELLEDRVRDVRERVQTLLEHALHRHGVGLEPQVEVVFTRMRDGIAHEVRFGITREDISQCVAHCVCLVVKLDRSLGSVSIGCLKKKRRSVFRAYERGSGRG